MEKQHGSFQQKTSAFFGEGMRIIKGGLKEAGRLINVTADATRLHIEKETNLIGIHREYHRLGVELYNLIGKDPNRRNFAVSETMRDIVKRIRDSEKEISTSSERLSHMTVVREPEPAPRKPPSVGAGVQKPPRMPRKGKPRTGKGRRRSAK